MLPKTVEDVVNACADEVERRVHQAGYLHERSRVRDIVEAVLTAAGLRLDDAKVSTSPTLIYPSTQGTNTSRYQVGEQRNVRFRGRRK